MEPMTGMNDGLVELVDATGRTVGATAKLAAHQPPGQLHRAFSVFLVDDAGRLLLQRRADGKYHSGGLWSNSCCSHPSPGQTPAEAAAKRVTEELGLVATDLAEVATVTYRVTDEGSGLVEHEFNHVFVGTAPTEPAPDPAEVADVAWVTLAELERLRATEAFTAWFPAVFEAALPSLTRRAGRH